MNTLFVTYKQYLIIKLLLVLLVSKSITMPFMLHMTIFPVSTSIFLSIPYIILLVLEFFLPFRQSYHLTYHTQVVPLL